MFNYLQKVIIFNLLCIVIISCTIVPANRTSDPQRIALAKQFLYNIDAGEMVVIGLHHKIEKESKDQPGMTELFKRAFSAINKEDFVEMAANIYSRYLTQTQLEELARFTGSDVGKRFFNISFQKALNKEKDVEDDFLRSFNADELTMILKFAQSETALALKSMLPDINREMKDEGFKLGKKIMQDFINKQ